MLLFGAQAMLAGALIATLIRKNMENDPLRSTGAIYNINTPTRGDVAKGPWQWNTFPIKAIGSRIKVTLNDVLVNDFTDPSPGLFEATSHCKIITMVRRCNSATFASRR